MGQNDGYDATLQQRRQAAQEEDERQKRLGLSADVVNLSSKLKAEKAEHDKLKDKVRKVCSKLGIDDLDDLLKEKR